MGRVEKISESARGDIETKLLTKSLSDTIAGVGGFLIRPAIEYIPSDESIEYVFHNTNKGISVGSGFNRNKVKPKRGWTIIVITDGSAYLLIGDVSGKGKDSKTKIPLFEINSIESREGIFKNRIIFETDNYTYSVPVKPDDDVAGAAEYIRGRKEGEIKTSSHETNWSVSVLYSVDPDTFEAILANLWETKGYVTEMTANSGDKGIDVTATADDEYILIQAKRYKPQRNKVGIRQVQRTAGLLSDNEFDPAAVVVATTSEFTSQAIERASNIQGLRLMNGSDIVSELIKYEIPPSRFNIKNSEKGHSSTDKITTQEENDDITAENDENALTRGESLLRSSSGSFRDRVRGVPQRSGSGSSRRRNDTDVEKTDEGLLVEGKYLQVTLTGLWHHELDGPTEGYFISFIIHNKCSKEWRWKSHEELIIIDDNDYTYQTNRDLRSQDLPAGWQTRDVSIQQDTRIRYLAYIELSPDVNISKIKYKENVATATNAYLDLASADIPPKERQRRIQEEELIEFTLDSNLMNRIDGPPEDFPVD
jgi:restriction endonuclease Mrr